MKTLITGKTGIGKTTILQKMGIAFFDMDQIVKKKFYKKGFPLVEEMKNAFGDHIVNVHGNIDTSVLGASLFKGDIKWKDVNSLVAPYVRKFIKGHDGIFEMAGYINTEEIYRDLFDKVILLESSKQYLDDKFTFIMDKKKIQPIEIVKIKFDLKIDITDQRKGVEILKANI